MSFIFAFGAMLLSLMTSAVNGVTHIANDQQGQYAQGGYYRQSVASHDAAMAAYQLQVAAYNASVANYSANAAAANAQLDSIIANTAPLYASMNSIWWADAGNIDPSLPNYPIPTSVSMGPLTYDLVNPYYAIYAYPITLSSPTVSYGTFFTTDPTTVQQYQSYITGLNQYVAGLTPAQQQLALEAAGLANSVTVAQANYTAASGPWNNCIQAGATWYACANYYNLLAPVTASSNAYSAAVTAYNATMPLLRQQWLAACGVTTPSQNPPSPPASLAAGVSASN